MSKVCSQILMGVFCALLLAGCGKNPSVNITCTTGSGFKPESRYGETGISLTDASFENGTLTFTYTNTHSKKDGASFDGEVSLLKVKTYNGRQVLVDEKTVQMFPGEIGSLPCEGKIVRVSTDTKGENIARVDVEHVCFFSTERWKKTALGPFL